MSKRNIAMKKMHFHLMKASAFAMKELALDHKFLATLVKAGHVKSPKALQAANASPFAQAAQPAAQAADSTAVTAPGNQAHYVTWGPTVSRSGFTLSFMARASNDIAIAVMGARAERAADAIEVVVGGFGDNQSVIRQGTQGRVLTTNTVTGRARKAATAGLWVAYLDGVLSVGHGGNPEPFMSAPVTLPAGEALQVGFAGWDSVVSVSNVVAK